MQKLFSLLQSHLFIFASVAYAFCHIQKIIAETSVKELYPYVFFENTVSGEFLSWLSGNEFD